MTHRFLHHAALFGTCALLSLSACGSEPQQAAPDHETVDRTPTAGGDASSEEHVGSVELALAVGNTQLDSMNYAIVGAGFTTSGRIDVSHSSKLSTIIGGIPFGTNYALTITGQGASSAPLDCSGSTSFNLDSVGPVPVTIPINCREPAVVEPPTPAPVPPFAIFTLACLLATLGAIAQRRTIRG